MKDVRERLHMTQAQLAEALGISTRTVATYEAGAEPPKAIRLACLWLEHEATANAPAPDAWRLGIEERLAALEDQSPASAEARMNAIEDGLGAVMKRLDRIYDNASKAFAELGERVQKLEMRPAPKATTMSESDIGMIARRAARSVTGGE